MPVSLTGALQVAGPGVENFGVIESFARKERAAPWINAPEKHASMIAITLSAWRLIGCVYSASSASVSIWPSWVARPSRQPWGVSIRVPCPLK